MVVQGDVVFPNCRQFAKYLNNDNVNPPRNIKQAQSVLKRCEEQNLTSKVAALPNTGGVPLLPVAGSLTLVVLGGLLLRHRLNY